LIGWKFIRL